MARPDLELVVEWQRSVHHDRQRLDALLARYREPHRRYHGAVHVMWVVRHVRELALVEPVGRLDEIVAAALYHDAVYDPTRADNERASAALARRELTALGWPATSADRVASMILATAHIAASASAPDHTSDTALLLDADLAILGADPATYDAYVNGVRAEYDHLDDLEWRRGRASVLRSLLERPNIYLTAAGRSRWEARARANLTAELAGTG